MAKGVILLSGGIDSPVAAHLIAGKGAELYPLYFDNAPYADEEMREHAIRLANRLKELHSDFHALVVLPHGESLAEFANKCERKYTCVLCKRMMFRAASEYAKRVGAAFLVTGDSLGQVACQTLPNMVACEQASAMPIVRPLIGLDKQEIITIAKEIGTYELSTAPAGSCGIVPDRPATQSTLEAVLREESKADIPGLLAKTLKDL
jgi:thiamine biosynthesis protein ThiI